MPDPQFDPSTYKPIVPYVTPPGTSITFDVPGMYNNPPATPGAAAKDPYKPKSPDEQAAYDRYQVLKRLLGKMMPDRSTNDANNAMQAFRSAAQSKQQLAGYNGMEGMGRVNALASATDPAMNAWAEANAAEDDRYSGLLNQLDNDRLSIVQGIGGNALAWDQNAYQRDLRDRARRMGIDWSNRQTSNALQSAAVKSSGDMAVQIAKWFKDKK